MQLARKTISLIALSLALCACARAQRQPESPQAKQPEAQAKPQSEKKPARPADPNKFAIVVAGVGGEESYTKKFTAQAMRLSEALTSELGVAGKNVHLLTEVAAGGAEDG